MEKQNLKKAIFTLLYDQCDIPDMQEDDSDSSFINHIIYALIERNEKRCPFKCSDCIGKCKDNMIGCVSGLEIDCNKEVEEIWKEFIGIKNE